MVKGSSDLMAPGGQWPRDVCSTGTVPPQPGVRTGGQGRPAAICLHTQAPWASVSTFPGVPLTHRAFFSFLSPQPLHNRHNEPGYLFCPQSAASSQLQVRHCCSSARVGRRAEHLPWHNSFHSHHSLKELALSCKWGQGGGGN